MAHYKPTLPKVTLIYHVILRSLIGFQPLEVITVTKPHNRDQRDQARASSSNEANFSHAKEWLNGSLSSAVGH